MAKISMHKRLRMKFSFVLAYIFACIKIECTLYFYYLLFITSYKFFFLFSLRALRATPFFLTFQIASEPAFSGFLAYSFIHEKVASSLIMPLPFEAAFHDLLLTDLVVSPATSTKSALPDDAVHRAVIPIRLRACA